MAGKAQRVAGFFTLMVGSGVILDTADFTIGAAVLGTGAALFAWGAVAGHRSARTLAPFREENR
jgi:hypothetical protein